MLSMGLTLTVIFLIWGMSLLVEAQDCPPFKLPNNTRLLKNSSYFRCNSEYRTMAELTCMDGEWDIRPSCQEIDYCARNPCLNGGTCVPGIKSYTCICPNGTYGTKCKKCNVKEGYYMGYENTLIMSADYSVQDCAKGCAETPECTAYDNADVCFLQTFPFVEVKQVPNVDACIRACYANRNCTGFTFDSLATPICQMFNTTSGLPYYVHADRDRTTSVRACEDLFTEDR